MSHLNGYVGYCVHHNPELFPTIKQKEVIGSNQSLTYRRTQSEIAHIKSLVQLLKYDSATLQKAAKRGAAAAENCLKYLQKQYQTPTLKKYKLTIASIEDLDKAVAALEKRLAALEKRKNIPSKTAPRPHASPRLSLSIPKSTDSDTISSTSARSYDSLASSEKESNKSPLYVSTDSDDASIMPLPITITDLPSPVSISAAPSSQDDEELLSETVNLKDVALYDESDSVSDCMGPGTHEAVDADSGIVSFQRLRLTEDYCAAAEEILKVYAVFIQRKADRDPVPLFTDEADDPVQQALYSYENAAIDKRLERDSAQDTGLPLHRSDFHVVRDRLKRNMAAATTHKQEVLDLVPKDQKPTVLKLLPILETDRAPLESPRYHLQRQGGPLNLQDPGPSVQEQSAVRVKAAGLSNEELVQHTQTFQKQINELRAVMKEERDFLLDDASDELGQQAVQAVISSAHAIGVVPQQRIAALHEAYQMSGILEQDRQQINADIDALKEKTGDLYDMEAALDRQLLEAVNTLGNIADTMNNHSAQGKIGDAMASLKNCITSGPAF